ncbi:MAG TPA: transglycosylase SLT domain-containing protein [Anaerolineaceae bacterium]|nr:transglycosylase SLT domain-containing protein [Anaerolineaceae bacterium]
MARTQQAIFPCLFVGVLAVIFLTSLASNFNVAQAAENPGAASNADAASQPGLQAACSLPSSYPGAILNWCGLIETYSKKYGLDGRLIAAVMLEESGGDPDAYSSSGAVGLMQIMPRDGLAADFMCNASPCFSKRPTMAELSDPEYNISYGSRMLAGLIQKYGNVRDALKAYGPINYGYKYADIVLSIFENYI